MVAGGGDGDMSDDYYAVKRSETVRSSSSSENGFGSTATRGIAAILGAIRIPRYRARTRSPRTRQVYGRQMRRLPVALLLALVGCASSITPNPTLDVGTPGPSHTSWPSPTSAATPTTSELNELAEEALRNVRMDARVDEFLDRNPFEVDRVAIEGDWVHLLLAFDGPVVGPVPWDTICEAGFVDGPITGAHWVIDLEASSVVASSPLWGENSCAPLPDTD